MAISRALRKLKITRKKKVLHAQERDTPEVQQKRRDFRGEIAGVDPRRLVFVDESGANTAMTRTHGRAPVGERVHGAVPGHWDSVTLICGLRLSGVTAPVVFQGATDTAAFQSYVEQVLVPELRPEDVVIWDNLKPHKAEAVIAAVEQAGARVVPLPPSSPDLTPIEEMFSKVKGHCDRRRRGRRRRSLRRSARPCMTFLRRTSRDGSNPVRRTQCNRECSNRRADQRRSSPGPSAAELRRRLASRSR